MVREELIAYITKREISYKKEMLEILSTEQLVIIKVRIERDENRKGKLK